MPTLKRGSTGPAVERLQFMLNRLGCGAITIDGKFGAATEAAVKVFQTKNGLTADGKFGPISQAKMQPLIDAEVGRLVRACVAAIERDTNYQYLEALLYG